MAKLFSTHQTAPTSDARREEICDLCHSLFVAPDLEVPLAQCDLCEFWFCPSCGHRDEERDQQTCRDCWESWCELCSKPLCNGDEIYECVFCGVSFCTDEVEGNPNHYVCACCES